MEDLDTLAEEDWVGRTARSFSVAPNSTENGRRSTATENGRRPTETGRRTKAFSVSPNENELIEDKWAGRRARTMSRAQPREPAAVDKLIKNEYEREADLRISDKANNYAKEATPLFEATEWLKNSLLEIANNPDMQRRVEQLLGSQNFLTNLSGEAWLGLQNYCEDHALSLGMQMEAYAKKAELSPKVGGGLDGIFSCEYGKPRHMDLFSSSEEANHRYEVVLDERAREKRMTVWRDATSFQFDIRQDIVLHSCHQFVRDESKSNFWNDKAYIHCLRMVAMAVDLRFQADVETMCKKAGGEFLRGAIKDFERMKTSCIAEYRRERFPRAAHNLDVNRNRTIFETAEDLLSFTQALEAHARFGKQPVRVQNTFTDDEDVARDNYYHRSVRINWLYTPGITYKDLLDSSLSELWDRYYEFDSVEGCGAKDPDEPWESWRDQIGLALKYLKGLVDEQVQIIVETDMILRPYLETQEEMILLRKIFQSPSPKALYLEFSAEDHEISDKSYNDAQDAAVNGLEKFLQDGKDVNRDLDADHGFSRLCFAAMNGHFKEVDKLLKIRGIDVNKPIWDTGATPLYLASQYGHASVVQKLSENRNIRVNQSRTDGGEAKPLHIAAQNGHDEVAKLLLLSPAIKVNAVLTIGERTPLFVAAYYGHEKIVEYLLEHPKVRVNQATNDGATPLYIAAQQGHEDVVRAFLNRDDIHVNSATTDEGRSALSIACLLGHAGIAKQLLSHPSINVNQPTLTGATPLFMAAQEGHEDIVKMLLMHKSIKVNQARTKDKATPLQIAQALKHENIVELLEKKVDVNDEKCCVM